MSPRLLLATTNQGKLRELRQILATVPAELVALEELARPPQVEETERSFLGNALLKARAYAGWSGMAALAEDSGLEVDALGGAPGVTSARYAGPAATDRENLDKLLGALRGVPAPERRARYRCTAVLVDPSGGVWHAEASWEGRLLEEATGAGGFGYDPVFVPLGWDRTVAEAPQQLKDAQSHRARALRALRPAVEAWAARTA